ncbi:hypothetical protein [Methylobacterium durans]|nr:hypothetical protein [Methylobacterium durans]
MLAALAITAPMVVWSLTWAVGNHFVGRPAASAPAADITLIR